MPSGRGIQGARFFSIHVQPGQITTARKIKNHCDEQNENFLANNLFAEENSCVDSHNETED